jgi:hypothetical protein
MLGPHSKVFGYFFLAFRYHTLICALSLFFHLFYKIIIDYFIRWAPQVKMKVIKLTMKRPRNYFRYNLKMLVLLSRIYLYVKFLVTKD